MKAADVHIKIECARERPSPNPLLSPFLLRSPETYRAGNSASKLDPNTARHALSDRQIPPELCVTYAKLCFHFVPAYLFGIYPTSTHCVHSPSPHRFRFSLPHMMHLAGHVFTNDAIVAGVGRFVETRVRCVLIDFSLITTRVQLTFSNR